MFFGEKFYLYAFKKYFFVRDIIAVFLQIISNYKSRSHMAARMIARQVTGAYTNNNTR